MSKHTMSCRLAVVMLLSVAAVAVGPGGVARADDDGKKSATGRGSSFQADATKYFTFSAEQRSSRTLAARGRVKMRQQSSVFGDFSLRGRVTCLSIAGNRAVIGLIIVKGDGTATGQEGRAFRLFVTDGEPTNDPDRFDNSGFEAGQPDCTQPAVFPSGGTVFEDGEITVGRHHHHDDD